MSRGLSLVVLALALCGCSGSDGASGNGGAAGASCDTDPLKTGLVAKQTGVSVDAFDCAILKWSASYKEPDPMIFKVIIYVESQPPPSPTPSPTTPSPTPSPTVSATSPPPGQRHTSPPPGV